MRGRWVLAHSAEPQSRFRKTEDCYISNLLIASWRPLRNRAASKPSIWAWWNWKETGSVVLKNPRRYLPQARKGLEKKFGIDANHSVDFAQRQCRGVDGHVLFAQKVVFVGVVDFMCQPEVVFVEPVEILREGYVAVQYSLCLDQFMINIAEKV